MTLNLEAGERIRFTFLENNVFRMYMAAPGDEFQEYPTPNSSDHTAAITDKSDDEYYTEYNVVPTVTSITIAIDKATSMMTVTNASGATVLKEGKRADPVSQRKHHPDAGDQRVRINKNA